MDYLVFEIPLEVLPGNVPLLFLWFQPLSADLKIVTGIEMLKIEIVLYFRIFPTLEATERKLNFPHIVDCKDETKSFLHLLVTFKSD